MSIEIVLQYDNDDVDFDNDSDGEECEMCCMCRDPLHNGTPLYTINCDHVLHLECIYYWSHTKGSKKKCPLCKNKLDKNEIKSEVKEKIPDIIVDHKQKENDVSKDELLAELLQQYDTLIVDKTIMFNMHSFEWVHLFEKLCIMKKFNNINNRSFTSLFEDIEQHYKPTIGRRVVNFYAKMWIILMKKEITWMVKNYSKLQLVLGPL